MWQVKYRNQIWHQKKLAYNVLVNVVQSAGISDDKYLIKSNS